MADGFHILDAFDELCGTTSAELPTPCRNSVQEEPPLKRPRVATENEVRNHMTWVKLVQDTLSETVGRLVQKRPLITASLCSGLNTHHIALQDFMGMP